MTQCRELENSHHEKLSDIAVVTLEKFMKNELEEELPDELRNVSVCGKSFRLLFTTVYCSCSLIYTFKARHWPNYKTLSVKQLRFACQAQFLIV